MLTSWLDRREREALGYLIEENRLLICDRDTKWSAPVRARLRESGIRVVHTPYQVP